MQKYRITVKFVPEACYGSMVIEADSLKQAQQIAEEKAENYEFDPSEMEMETPIGEFDVYDSQEVIDVTEAYDD